jgi:hypothetical protein
MKNSPEKLVISLPGFFPSVLYGRRVNPRPYTLSLGPGLNAAFNGTLDNINICYFLLHMS